MIEANERNKFLADMIGCRRWDTETGDRYKTVVNFSTWEGFGKLWEWAKEKEWWSTFLVVECGVEENISDDLINPPHFARVLYKFLKKNA